ncbi:MAG: exopolysaccharide biosynthesis protein [Verrucomicrobiota bacterium]
MASSSECSTLQDLLDRIEEASHEGARVRVRTVLEQVGYRSFGPLLLLAGLVTLAPLIGDVPGVPTLVALFVLLIAVQLLMRRKYFWLPRWMIERSVSAEKFCRAVRWSRSPARWIDRLLRPRLAVFSRGPAVGVIATVCMAIACLMPLMEVIPFSANGAGAALSTFGLALIARDGLLALVAFLITFGTGGFIAYQLAH